MRIILCILVSSFQHRNGIQNRCGQFNNQLKLLGTRQCFNGDQKPFQKRGGIEKPYE